MEKEMKDKKEGKRMGDKHGVKRMQGGGEMRIKEGRRRRGEGDDAGKGHSRKSKQDQQPKSMI